MQSIMDGEIAYSFRRSDLSIDRTTKSDDGLLRFPAISQFGYSPDDLLFVYPLSQGVFIPPESGRRRDYSRRPPTPPDGPFGIRRFLSTGQNLICGSELGFVRCVPGVL
jgi:hypothetical protein